MVVLTHTKLRRNSPPSFKFEQFLGLITSLPPRVLPLHIHEEGLREREREGEREGKERVCQEEKEKKRRRVSVRDTHRVR